MLVLTRETGQPVLSSEGVAIGRLRDLTVTQQGERPRVHRIAVGSRHRIAYLIPWRLVASFEHASVAMRVLNPEEFTVDSDGIALAAPDELLLARDVLDTQIIDVNRHRVARVADVLFERLPDGGLEVAAVDVGLAGVCRRLGLSRLSERLPQRAIDWSELHLTSERGHASQLATTTAAVHRLDSRGLAELLARLSVESAADVIGAVRPDRAADAVATSDPEVVTSLLRALPPSAAMQLLDEMPADSAGRYRSLVTAEPPPQRRFLRLHGWRRDRPPPAARAHGR